MSARDWRDAASAWWAKQRATPYDLASYVLLLALAFVVLFTFQDIGIRFDEHAHILYGDRIIDFYRSGFQRYSFRLDTPYGGGFDLLAALGRRLMPFGRFEETHLVCGVIGVLGLLGTWKLGRLLFGPSGGFWSLVLLALTPDYYGHTFNDPKDVPFAAAYIWTLYFLCAVIEKLPEVPKRLWLKLGVAAGLGLSVRIGGLLVVFYVGVWVGYWLLHQAFVRRSTELLYRHARRIVVGATASVAVAWGVMLLGWPWAMFEPLRRPIIALSEMSNYAANKSSMVFKGELVQITEAPWDYLPRYFAAKLPELLIVLFALGLVLGARWVYRHRRDASQLHRVLWFTLLGFAVVFPFLFAVATQHTLYEGIRHFLFLVPPICVIAAGGLVASIRFLARRRAAYVWIAYAPVILLCLHQANRMRQLHPHQYLYYNDISGGLAGVEDYLETSGPAVYKETFAMLSEHLWKTERDEYLRSVYSVSGCFSPEAVQEALPANFAKRDESPDFAVNYTKSWCHREFESRPEVLRLERNGVLYALVRDLRSWRSRYWRKGHPVEEYLENAPHADPQKNRPIDDLRDDGVSISWATCLVVDQSQRATLAVYSDDPSTLRLDGEPIISGTGNEWKMFGDWLQRAGGWLKELAIAGMDDPSSGELVAFYAELFDLSNIIHDAGSALTIYEAEGQTTLTLEPGAHLLQLDYEFRSGGVGTQLLAGFDDELPTSLPAEMLRVPTADWSCEGLAP